MERIRAAQPPEPPPLPTEDAEAVSWEDATANLKAAFPQGHLEEHYQLEDGSWVNRGTGEVTPPGTVPGN